VGDASLGSRYAISWYVLDHEGNVVIPDEPLVRALSSDALQVAERVLVPLRLSDGYYRLDTTIMAADAENQLAWSAGGAAYFKLDLAQLLIMDPQDWIWQSSGLNQHR
jgi:hypothetical protein